MKRKLMAMILTVCFVLSSAMSAFAIDLESINATLGKMIDSMPEGAKDVVNSIDAVIPNISQDSTVDSRIRDVENYTEGASGIINQAIGMVLEYTDKDTLIRVLNGLKEIPESLRAKYVDMHNYRKAMDISSDTKRTLTNLMQKVYTAIPNIAVLVEASDEVNPKYPISEGFVANIMSLIKEINGGKYLFKMSSSDYKVSIDTLDSDFASRLDAVWEGSATIANFSTRQFVQDFVNALNNNITSSTERKQLGEVFCEVGLMEKMPTESSGGNNGSGGNGGGGNPGSGTTATPTPTPSASPKPNATAAYEELDSLDGLTEELLGNGKIISVNVTIDGAASNSEAVVSIPDGKENQMLYRFENGELQAVKYSSVMDGKLSALVTTGNYIIKTVPDYFTDANGWGKAYIEALRARGIISGKAEGLFMPDDSITREEFVKLVVELFGMTDSTATAEFTDVDSGAWYYQYVATAAKKGIVSGVGDGQFGIGQKITRQDMAKIISNILTSQGIATTAASQDVFADYTQIADYAQEAVLSIYNLGIISGDDQGNFNPNAFATRQESAKMIYGLLGVYIKNAA